VLDDQGLDALRVKYGKIAIVDWDGHQLVFKRPTREHMRDYRRKRESPSEKHDALEQLEQFIIVAFDGETDPNKARMAFTGKFLEEYPGASSSGKISSAVSVLSGIVEEEEADDLGKGVRFKPPLRKRTPTDSPNGSSTSPEAASSANPGGSLPS
jgi:hypothetical protein